MFFFDCLILGDSIAVGVAEARPECAHIAKGGINSKDFLNANRVSFNANTVIISLGANDFYENEIDTEKNLNELRSNIFSQRVFWILPMQHLRPKQFEIVLNVANNHKDAIIYRPLFHITNDGIHPNETGYKIIADQTK